MTPPEKPRRDHRQEVTDSIIRMLEEGTAPWQKPWHPGALELPFNPISGKPYRGGNAIHLLTMAARRGYEDPRWLTYNQAAQSGWQVRKGEKGTQIEFWDFPKRERASAVTPNDTQPDSGNHEHSADTVHRDRPIHKIYTVFNAQQVDGIPPHEPKQRAEFEIVQSAESILRNSGARINHDQHNRAFYNRASDSIHLPPKAAFVGAAQYYGTALHELAHWSGAEGRLNRETLTESYRFGDQNYAKEELRAELTTVFLAAERGIPHDPAQHAAYVNSWIKSLQDDKNEIFRAAKDAHTAADYLLSLERAKDLADTSEQEESLRRETTEFVAKFEPETDSVTMQHKATATHRRTPAAAGRESAEQLAQPKRLTETVLDNETSQFPRSLSELGTSFTSAQAIVRQQLGEGARTYVAQTDSGVYRGEVVAQTDHHVLQRLNGASAVAHIKHLLSEVPAVGEAVLIRYSNNAGQVADLPARSRGREIGR